MLEKTTAYAQDKFAKYPPSLFVQYIHENHAID